MKMVKRVVFKEILDGDRRKYKAESNDANSGGGARDLRFRPYEKFRPIFEKMLPEVNEKGVAVGQFYWYEDEQLVIKDAFFHPETNARPKEGRISNIDKYLPVEKVPHESEGTAFILFIQDNESKVWPFFVTEKELSGDAWNEAVSEPILKSHKKKKNIKRTTSGYLDFETGEVFCNHD